MGGFSRRGLIDQLVEFDGFVRADAVVAVDSLGVSWREQAVQAAESYMKDVGGFSRPGLIDQLTEFDGFTPAQAAHAADAVGL